jgi:hypothetical protein
LSKLQAALAWAARGFRVFPLLENDKDPTDIAWTLHATTDPATIRRWWTDPVLGFERNLNIGFLTTDWIVPDIDVKEGKPGLQTFMDLGFDFDTLTMRTPTGGYHVVYRGLDRLVGGSPLGEGLDVRSHNGYVVAPGSTLDVVVGGGDTPIAVCNLTQEKLQTRLAAGAVIEQRTYEVDIDLPVAEFPEQLRGRLKAPRQRPEIIPAGVELDTPEIIEIVAHWLAHDAPVAVEGQNGDDTTYRVACRMRDFGISDDAALDLFLDEYNPRCEPPWSPEEAKVKVENAYRYATGSQGAASPAAMFEGVTIIPPTRVNGHASAAPLLGNAYPFGNMIYAEDIEARTSVLGTILLPAVVTTFIAAGGGGKSALMATIAAHLAVGKPFLGHEANRPGKCIVVNAEDDLAEQSRRLNAICQRYELDREVVREKLCLVGIDNNFHLQITMGNPPVINAAAVEQLIERASDPEVVLVAIDPLVEIHSANENDNTAMKYVMEILRMIARRANVAVAVVHHTGKPPASDKSSMAGDQNAGRGASSIPAAARVVLTVTPAKPEDCIELGVPTKDHGDYVRIEAAKQSYSKRRGPQWLRWETVPLVNGDRVGVLVEHDATESYDRMAHDVGGMLAANMMGSGAASMPIDEAATLLAASDPLMAREDRATLRTRLSRLLAMPTPVPGGHIQIVTEVQGSKRITRVVLG